MRNIAVIEGGFSLEKVISLKSAQTVLEHLDKSKYKVFRVRIDEDGWFYYNNGGEMSVVDKNDFSVKVEGEKICFDFAFIMIHGTPGEDGKLQAYFDMMKVPYSTCDQVLSTLTFNKFVCNRFLSELGFNVAEGAIVNRGADFDAEAIIAKVGLPCFVKPADGGSSFGITKVKKMEDLEEAVKLATQDGVGTQALIESFLEGQEVTNGVFRSRKGVQVLPVTEIVTENEFFDYDAKYTGQSEEITPARISDDLTQKIKDITGELYSTLNMTGIARVDYIIVKDQPYIIEINTVPGMSGESIIPKMAKVEGVALSTLFEEVIEVGMKS